MRLVIHWGLIASLSIAAVSLASLPAFGQDYQQQYQQYQQAAQSMGNAAINSANAAANKAANTANQHLPQLPPPSGSNASFGSGLASGTTGVSPIGGNTEPPEPYEPQTTLGRMAKGLNPSNWKLPKFKLPTLGGLMPGQDEKDAITKRKDSLVSEVKQSAKRSWTRTKDAFNPMKLIPAGFRQPSDSQSGQAAPSGQANSFFGSFLKPSEQQAGSASEGVNDFLRNNRPLR